MNDKYYFEDYVKIDYQFVKTLCQSKPLWWKSYLVKNEGNEKIYLFDLSDQYHCGILLKQTVDQNRIEQTFYLLNDYYYLKWCCDHQDFVLKNPSIYDNFAIIAFTLNPRVFWQLLKSSQQRLVVCLDFTNRFIACNLNDQDEIKNFVLDHNRLSKWDCGLEIVLKPKSEYWQWKQAMEKLNQRFCNYEQFLITESEQNLIKQGLIKLNTYDPSDQYQTNDHHLVESWKFSHKKWLNYHCYYKNKDLLKINFDLDREPIVQSWMEKPWLNRLLSNYFSFLKPSNYQIIKVMIYLIESWSVHKQHIDYNWEDIIATWLINYLKNVIAKFNKTNDLYQRWTLLNDLNNDQSLYLVNNFINTIDDALASENKQMKDLVLQYFQNFDGSNLNRIKRYNFNINFYENDYHKINQFTNNHLLVKIMKLLYDLIYNEVGSEFWDLLNANVRFLPKTEADFKKFIINNQISEDQEFSQSRFKNQIENLKKYILRHYQKHNELDRGRIKILLDVIKERFEKNENLDQIHYLNLINKTKINRVENEHQNLNEILKTHPIYNQGDLHFIPIRSVGEAFLLSTHFANCAIQRALKIVQLDQKTFDNKRFNYLLVGYDQKEKRFVSMIELQYFHTNGKVELKNELARFNHRVNKNEQIDLEQYQKDAFMVWKSRLQIKQWIANRNEIAVINYLEKHPHLMHDQWIKQLIRINQGLFLETINNQIGLQPMSINPMIDDL